MITCRGLFILPARHHDTRVMGGMPSLATPSLGTRQAGEQRRGARQFHDRIAQNATFKRQCAAIAAVAQRLEVTSIGHVALTGQLAIGVGQVQMVDLAEPTPQRGVDVGRFDGAQGLLGACISRE